MQSKCTHYIVKKKNSSTKTDVRPSGQVLFNFVLQLKNPKQLLFHFKTKSWWKGSTIKKMRHLFSCFSHASVEQYLAV